MSKINRKIFALHSWAGLIAGVFILVFFLTGALIVFREELNRVIDRPLFVVKPARERLNYQALYDTIVKQVDNSVYLYSFRYLPQKPEETLEMRIYDARRQDYGLLYANPYTGQVLGLTFNSWYDVLLRLHYQFYLGRIGESLAALFALALLLSVLTGFWVYRKNLWKVLSLQIRINRKNAFTLSSSLHRIIGVWSLLFHFVLALSGFWMLKGALTYAHFKTETEKIAPPPSLVSLDLDRLIRQAEAHFGGRINYLNFPRQAGDPLNIAVTKPHHAWLYGDYNNSIDFDLQSGKVLKVFREEDLSGLERFEYALYTLHFGQFGGLGLKILYCVLSLAGALLSITGFILWKRRKKNNQPKITSSGRAVYKPNLTPKRV
jgi:uncharacterized iron-regulated membrane protein